MSSRHFGSDKLTSRTATTGIHPQSGSRGANTRAKASVPIVSRSIPLPAGSIALLKSPDLAKPRFNEPLVLALLFNCLLWFGFALIVRALFF